MTRLLDTNVLSELIRSTPAPEVISWLAAQPPDSVFVSAVTQAEMLTGARILPVGQRRSHMEAMLVLMFEEDFAQRVLPFDRLAATAYADIVAARRGLGRPISQFDAQIAAIARVRGCAVVTRNVRDFEHCGVGVINPWSVG